jgi:hypothetical protein
MAPMDSSIRVMVERGKKKRTVACAFDWSGWDRSGKIEEDALRVLESYRPRYAKVAALAGLSDEFSAAGSWWTVQYLIRRCAWHMLDHAREMEDRDLS